MEIGYKPGTRLFSRNFLPFIKGFCMDLEILLRTTNWIEMLLKLLSGQVFPAYLPNKRNRNTKQLQLRYHPFWMEVIFEEFQKKHGYLDIKKKHHLPGPTKVACLAPWSHRTNGIFQNIFVHGSRGWSFCAPAFCWGLVSESLKGPWRMLGPPKKRETMIDFLLTLVSN